MGHITVQPEIHWTVHSLAGEYSSREKPADKYDTRAFTKPWNSKLTSAQRAAKHHAECCTQGVNKQSK